jgi:hypothetical protein
VAIHPLVYSSKLRLEYASVYAVESNFVYWKLINYHVGRHFHDLRAFYQQHDCVNQKQNQNCCHHNSAASGPKIKRLYCRTAEYTRVIEEEKGKGGAES